MKKVVSEGRPHLFLFALRNIIPGEEITYDYGGTDWPWRKQVCQNRVAKCHFSLKDRFIVHIGINVDIRMIQNSFFAQTKVNAVIPPYDYIKFCMIRDSIAVWLI